MHLFLHLFLLALLTFSLSAKSIADIEGKPIVLPDKIERVFGASPPTNYLIYALNPDKMIGLNFKAKNPFNGASEELLERKFLSLPVIGSFHGGGQSINLETLIAHKPELILVWQDDMLVQTISKEIAKTKVPAIMIPFREIDDMPKAFRLAGEAIGESKRGELLAGYIEKVILEVKSSVSKSKQVRYYYAEGTDGLSTECDQSFHVRALNFVGGENVHKCQQSGVLGLEKINFETLLKYDPDVIIVQTAFLYNEIKEDPLWKNLRALKSGRVHLVPTQPFNWIDRPPSFMRVLGIQWIASVFHPEVYKVDLIERSREFYDLFLRVKLSDQQIKNILGVNK